MKVKRVMVVGSSGYIGQNIVRALCESGYKVIGLQRTKCKYSHINFETNFGDVKNYINTQSVQRMQIDAVIYLAANNHVESEKSLSETISNDVIPFEILCKNLSNSLIVYFSTFQVYGINTFTKIVSEESQILGLSNYAIAHQLCEKILLRTSPANKNRFVIFRLTNAVGALHDYTKTASQLVGNDFAWQLSVNQKIIMKSDGTPVRNFIGISDISMAVNYVLKNDEVTGVFNLAGTNTKSISWLACQYANVYQQLTNKKTEIFDNCGNIVSDSASNVETYTVSIDKIKSVGINVKESIMGDVESSIMACIGKNS